MTDAQLAVVPMQIQALQHEMEQYHARQQSELSLMYREMSDRIETFRRMVRNQMMSSSSSASSTASSLLQQHRQRNATFGNAGGNPVAPSTPPRQKARDIDGAFGQAGGDDGGLDWGNHFSQHGGADGSDDLMSTPPPANQRRDMTPTGSPQSREKLPIEHILVRLQQHPSNSPPFNFENVYEQLVGKDDSPQMPTTMPTFSAPPSFAGPATELQFGAASSASSTIPMDSLAAIHGQFQTKSIQVAPFPSPSGRPQVMPIPNGQPDDLNIDQNARCQVLVEFKRQRVLQFDSKQYVSPGVYVVVGGDRGEDVGLVIYTWCETTSGGVQGIGLTGSRLTRSFGVGNGTVLRLARDQEVQELHNVQAELERRAVAVCQQRVLEHGLPMVIADAEYQFDKKKLTFYYEAQQRMDFRELVRDLFKTFRARIWMELVEN